MMATFNESTYNFANGTLTQLGVEEVLKWLEQGGNYPCSTCGSFDRGIMPVLVAMMGAKLPKTRGENVQRMAPPMGSMIVAKCDKCKAVSLYSANDIFENL